MTQSSGQISQGSNYSVQQGDTLFYIAEQAYGNGLHWTIIYHSNTQAIGPNPDPQQELIIGLVLYIPPSPGSADVGVH